ncbi:MAG: glycosyltransferase family 2 protein [Chthoniobacteraceae bacterium]
MDHPSVPSVTVVIPSYNHAAYIGAALESVVAQTLPAREIAVVDDGSRDGSPEIIRAFASANPGVNLNFTEQPNAGAHVALNRAIAGASGADFIAILNSDDLYEPERLERCVAWLGSHPEKAAVCTAYRLIGTDGEPLPADHAKVCRMQRIWADPSRDVAEWLGESNFTKTTSNYVIRADYARAHPFRAYRYAHDYFFASAAALEGAFGVLPEPLLRYRTHACNTIKADGRAPVAAELVRLEFDLLCELAPRLAASGDVRAAAVRYFRQLFESASDFRADVFLAFAAGLAADNAASLRQRLDALNPTDFPELAAPPRRPGPPPKTRNGLMRLLGLSGAFL